MRFLSTILLFSILIIATTQAQNCSFKEKELVLTSPLSSIYGTYLYPDNQKSFPCVLIIAGSGPTDRDGNSHMISGNNNSLKMLAESLAIQGVASLRYDKRGVGQSRSQRFTETTIRFEDYVYDAIEWINLLASNDSIKSLGIIGHSEGSLIGMIAAARSRTDFFISLNGAGMRADSVIMDQLKNQPGKIQKQVSEILGHLTEGETVDSIPATLTSLFRPTVQPYLISWLQYHPQTELAKLDIPVLIIQGRSDLQVYEKNALKLTSVKPGTQPVFIDSMNHVLKITGDDPGVNFNAYSNPDLPLPVFLTDTIKDFIKITYK
jgi:uncharacterized protein